MRVRILVVEPYAHSVSHAPQYARDVSLALANAGADVTLLTFDGVLGWRARDSAIECHTVANDVGIFAPLLRLLSRFLHFTFVLPAPDSFLTILFAAWRQRRHGYDVIHILDDALPTISPFALGALVKNCSIVTTLHNPYRERELVQDWHRKLRKAFKGRDRSMACRLLLARFQEWYPMAALRRFLCKRATERNRLAFVCLSEEERESYAQTLFYERTVCIPEAKPSSPPLAEHEARQALGLSEDETVFLSFGVNHDWKNYEVIFQAVQDLPAKFKLLFAGRTLLRDARQNDPRRLAQTYGWHENTVIIDRYIPDEEIPLYFCGADALILSYRKEFVGRSGGLRYASQYSVPVIASNGGPLGKATRRHDLGLTFTPDDPVSLKETLVAFLRLGQAEKQRMKKNLLAFACSPDQMARSYLSLYQSLLNRDAGSNRKRQESVETEQLFPDECHDWRKIKAHVGRYVFASRFLSGKLCLDVACGSGYGSNLLRKSGARMVAGGDLSTKAIEWARSHYAYDGLHFFLADAQQLPLKGESFDAVVSIETVEHLEEPRQFLRECYRVLKPNGYFICSTPNKLMHSYIQEPLLPYHKHEFHIDELRFLAAEEQFQAIAIYGQDFVKRDLRWRRSILEAKARSLLLALPGGQSLVDFLRHVMLGRQDARIVQLTEEDLKSTTDNIAALPHHGDLGEPRNFVLVARK